MKTVLSSGGVGSGKTCGAVSEVLYPPSLTHAYIRASPEKAERKEGGPHHPVLFQGGRWGSLPSTPEINLDIFL